jgi:hypothetical protein
MENKTEKTFWQKSTYDNHPDESISMIIFVVVGCAPLAGIISFVLGVILGPFVGWTIFLIAEAMVARAAWEQVTTPHGENADDR